MFFSTQVLSSMEKTESLSIKNKILFKNQPYGMRPGSNKLSPNILVVGKNPSFQSLKVSPCFGPN